MDTSNSAEVSNSTTEMPYNCSGADQMSLDKFRQITWWFSGVGQVKNINHSLKYRKFECMLFFPAQLLICIVGLLANSLSIVVLSSRQMNSVFYRLLICLATFDFVFLFFALLESIR